MPKPLLILDIDETLLFATKIPLNYPADFRLWDYYVYFRPGLSNFLAQVQPHYQLAIWSSASDDYVEEIVKQLPTQKETLLFYWGRSRCTYRRKSYIDSDYYLYENPSPFSQYQHYKILKKVKKGFGIPLEQMLIVDNIPEKVRFNYGNAIYVADFEGNTNDQELIFLEKYLNRIAGHTNFRTLEKRGWKTHT